jgi:hypothetical protein
MAEPQDHHLSNGYDPCLCVWTGTLLTINPLPPEKTTLTTSWEKEKPEEDKKPSNHTP